MKLKKMSIILTVALMVVAIVPVSASAVSLSASFSGGTYVSYDHCSFGGDWYTKSCWAQTKGYSGMHYVRAMVGKGNNVWADTGRCYANTDIKKTCTTPAISCKGFSWEFPTGYAYYGN